MPMYGPTDRPVADLSASDEHAMIEVRGFARRTLERLEELRAQFPDDAELQTAIGELRDWLDASPRRGAGGRA